MQAQATEIQWATGCTSFQSPAMISVSYNNNSHRITLYRSWPASKTLNVDIYRANRLSSLFTPTPFVSLHNQEKISIEFGTKKTFTLVEQGRQVEYYCTYYSFDTN